MIITLPKWMGTVKKLYNTRTGGQLDVLSISLMFALTIRIHGTAKALRQTARNIVDDVCREHKPNMKRLANEPDDAKVWLAVTKILDRVCDKLGYEEGVTFPREVYNFEVVEPEPVLEDSEIMRVLAEIGNELSDPKEIAREVHDIIRQVPKERRAGLYIIAGSKNPRAIIQATVRQFKQEN